VIVLVRHRDRVLLARSHRFAAVRYSVLAGFVEPGETLEEAVVREIREEVGVRVQNIRYFGSQPWPFPHQLMVGFVCDYAGGEIRIDPAELADARWFRWDALPEIPPPMSIARQLIDWFVADCQGAARG
jgi:NAD+ diphosphatase